MLVVGGGGGEGTPSHLRVLFCKIVWYNLATFCDKGGAIKPHITYSPLV